MALTDVLVLPLPVIVHSESRSLEVFLSGNFFDVHHQPKAHNDYVSEHGHIRFENSEEHILDLSITVLLIVGIMLAVASGYKKIQARLPVGFNRLLSPSFSS